MRESLDIIADLDNREVKRRAMSFLGTQTGMVRIRIEPKRATRSLRANAYYFGCLVSPFAQYLSEQDVRRYTTDDAHALLKAKILGCEEVMDPTTGVIFGEIPRSTHDMTTDQFADYIDRARAYLDEMFGIIAPEPDQFRQGVKS